MTSLSNVLSRFTLWWLFLKKQTEKGWNQPSFFKNCMLIIIFNIHFLFKNLFVRSLFSEILTCDFKWLHGKKSKKKKKHPTRKCMNEMEGTTWNMTALAAPVSVYKVTQVATQLGTRGFQTDWFLWVFGSATASVIGESVQGRESDHLKIWCEFINQTCILSKSPWASKLFSSSEFCNGLRYQENTDYR